MGKVDLRIKSLESNISHYHPRGNKTATRKNFGEKRKEMKEMVDWTSVVSHHNGLVQLDYPALLSF